MEDRCKARRKVIFPWMRSHPPCSSRTEAVKNGISNLPSKHHHHQCPLLHPFLSTPPIQLPPMAKSTSNRTILRLLIATVVLLNLISFILSILAEHNKTEIDDVKFDGKNCSLPKSNASRFGIAALICFSVAQILGTSIVSGLICSAIKAGFKAAFSCILLAVSWMSFGMAVVLMGVASSMNRRQPYGRGWLDGKCYVVKDGVFAGAGALVLLTAGCIVGTSGVVMRTLDGVREGSKRPPSLQGEN